ncbi:MULTISPECIES: DEAD/DEAH box helicase family protein [Salinibacter]|jgi:type III restriction enzyme|uniref:Type III restriction enzyme n=1 Tax=Salinibacter ruber TaxID=146919 RepID=A0A9X2ZNX1_9BACT|nr:MULTISPECIES: DEAD/DEAH box helicase family protein [Salinibacter]MCS3856416.1 type III restriction enzyme [Salinibacter ruber]MCS3859875.1 type III restriction enzyme [Salinibacter ruber]MCS3866681.1 type III restriction enzyme [Salinibacter ruber]
MSEDLKFQFDPNLQYQIDAIDSVVDVFDGLPEHDPGFTIGGQIVPNVPPYEHLEDSVLQANVRDIQERNDVEPTSIGLDVEEGLVVKYAGNESWRYPNLTVEMETGTGKTYVFLRTMYELRQRYGFSKFVVVVPSVAIYEGFVKNFHVTRDHFRALYDNETAALFEYSGDQISKVRSFATTSHMTIMVITIDSLNKHYNKIFKPSEQLPGSLLPIEFIQKTRPILIFDEPQSTVSSPRAKASARALHPLCALRYSATHRESPNLLYKLTPFDAYQKGLVKKIQVIGVTEEENFNEPYVALQSAARENGSFSAEVKTYVYEGGRAKETSVQLEQGDDLYEKTNREEHEGAGYVVDEISVRPDNRYIEFRNGVRLHQGTSHGPAKKDIFRLQIRETIQQHMKMQKRLRDKGIKVISLFFIDRVANYVDDDGIIRKLFDQEFNRLKERYSGFRDFDAADVQSGYFAEKDGEAVDADSSRKADRQARQEAYNLIMKDKERLLSFDEPISFIFAHSALKEGWDSPNVFQICTLNQTVSEVKKRQEIGRGLRIAVNQKGERIFDDKVNILTIVANESYEDYARGLQQEYEEDGEKAPPEPTNAKREAAKRRDSVYKSDDFRKFFDKLLQKAEYEINVDTDEIVEECTKRLNAQSFPDTKLLVQRGKFVRTQYEFELEKAQGEEAKIRYHLEDTKGSERSGSHWFEEGDRLKKTFGDEKLRGYRIANVGDRDGSAIVEFENKVQLVEAKPIEFEEATGEVQYSEEQEGEESTYPVFNLIDRAARETELTRPTLNQIFKGLNEEQKEYLFRNPEGFAGTFIDEIESVLAAHIAANIEFELTGDLLSYDLDDLFPEEMDYPQKELVEAGEQGLYDKLQTDSDVEERFVARRLSEEEEQLSFYLKFPPAFKLPLPNVIGDYNPDWGIVRYTDEGVKLELVRETKGTEDVGALQYPHEKRKIRCAHKLFSTLGIDYRPITDQTERWWESGHDDIPEGTLELL